MELKLLEDFLSLAKTRNFSRSSEERCISQPAFSRRIKALEIWAGTPLIDREVYPIELTTAGDVFKGIAINILRQLYEGREEINAIGWDGADPITIYAAQSLALNFLPDWLASVDHDFSVNEMRLIPGDVHICVETLLQGDADFMIAFTHPDIPVLIDESQHPYITIATDNYYPVSC